MQGLGTEHATHSVDSSNDRIRRARVIAHHCALIRFCDFVQDRKWIQGCRLPGIAEELNCTPPLGSLDETPAALSSRAAVTARPMVFRGRKPLRGQVM